MTEMQIALIGTGLMGTPAARRLLQAGYRVRVWNRTAAKAEALAADGATLAASPAEAVAGADLVMTWLENGPVVTGLLTEGGLAGALPPGCLFIDHSSIPPDSARAHHDLLAAKGIAALDAPVSGGPSGVEAGTLAIMTGGEAAAVDRARPVLSALGRVTHVGPAGAGQLAKLCNQLIVGATIGAVAEALILAEKAGADPAKVREALTGGFADSKILAIHGERMLTRRFIPGGAAKIHLKDMMTICATAEDAGLHLPVASHILTLFKDLCEAGEGEADHSGLYRQIARISGAEDLITP